MHDEVRAALREAIMQARRVFIPSSWTVADYLVWTRSGPNGWSCQTERRRLARGPVEPDSETLNRLTGPFADALRRHHPELFRTDPRFASGLDFMLAQRAVPETVREIVRRYGSLAAPPDVVEGVLDEFALFVDRETIDYDFVTPVINLRDDGAPVHVQFLDGTTLRRLDDAEATYLFGGPLDHFAFVSRGAGTGPADYALFGSYQEDRLWPFRADGERASDGLRERLRKIIVALRTFQAGPVGTTVVWRTPRTFFPLPVSLMPTAIEDEYVPHGTYRFAASRSDEFREHVRALQGELPPALGVACRRLAAAAIRVDPADRLIDAVIGMEAVLLAGIGDKHELRHRFALNYASLFDVPGEREAAFRRARDLYDLRSQIAHGADPGPEGRVDEAAMTAAQAANLACDALRFLIMRFLNGPERSRLGDATYWLRRVLGLAGG